MVAGMWAAPANNILNQYQINCLVMRNYTPAQKRHLSQSLQIRWVGGRQWAIRAPSGLHIRVRFSLSPTAVLVVAFHYARLQPAT